MKTIYIISFFAFLLIMNSCGSGTKITSTWKSNGVIIKKYEKIMVLGIIREADRNLRGKMENHLVEDLKSLGYTAASAYDVYGPKAFEGMNEEQACKKLSADGIDAFVTVVLLDKQRERYYVPARVMYTPYITYQNRFWGYYNSLYARIGEPGYYYDEVRTKYFWESNLFDLSSNKLVYSVQTQSFEPSSTDNLAHEYGQKIIKAMINSGVLQKQPGPAQAM